MCVNQRFFYNEAVTGRVMNLFPKYLVLINMISSKLLPTKQTTLVRSWIYSFTHQEGLSLHVSAAKKCTNNTLSQM